jgi:hypothetical protein
VGWRWGSAGETLSRHRDVRKSSPCCCSLTRTAGWCSGVGSSQAVRRLMSDECGDMAMHEAACGGDVAEVQRLVAAGLDVDEPCASGLRPLHYAATNGHLETVKALVESGADKNALTIAGGATPLHLAADGGHVDGDGVMPFRSGSVCAECSWRDSSSRQRATRSTSGGGGAQRARTHGTWLWHAGSSPKPVGGVGSHWRSVAWRAFISMRVWKLPS